MKAIDFFSKARKAIEIAASSNIDECKVNPEDNFPDRKEPLTAEERFRESSKTVVTESRHVDIELVKSLIESLLNVVQERLNTENSLESAKNIATNKQQPGTPDLDEYFR